MDDLTKIIELIPLLPDWAKFLSFQITGVIVCIYLLRRFIRQITSPEIVLFFDKMKSFTSEALKQLFLSLESPVDYPRLKIFYAAFGMITLYAMSPLLLLWFAVFLVLVGSTEEMVFWNRVLAISITALLFIAARHYFVQGEKQRLLFIGFWKSK
jgi:hypothetical protein